MKHSKEEFELSTSVIGISMIISVFTTRTNNGLGWFLSLLIAVPYEVGMQQRDYAREALV